MNRTNGRKAPTFDQHVDAPVRVEYGLGEPRDLMTFVYIHVLVFATWMIVLEQSPWPTLTLAVSLEAIFLSTFVMIGQNRQAAFQQAKADHDYTTVNQLLVENTELTRDIDALMQTLHAHILGGGPADHSAQESRHGHRRMRGLLHRVDRPSRGSSGQTYGRDGVRVVETGGRNRAFVSSAVPKPANWRFVHNFERYIEAHGPRVQCQTPGRLAVSGPCAPTWWADLVCRSGAGRRPLRLVMHLAETLRFL